MRLGLLAGLLLLPGAAANADPASEARFKALYTQEWTWRQHQTDDDEDTGGPHVRPHLPDVGAAAQVERLRVWSKARADLNSIPADSLSPESEFNRDIYARQLDALIAGQKYRDYEMPANPDTSFWANLASTGGRGFRTTRDYRNWINQLRELPRFYAQQTDNMRAGLARGFTPPKVTMTGRDAGVAVVAEAASPEATAFYKPFLQMPASIPAATRRRSGPRGPRLSARQ